MCIQPVLKVFDPLLPTFLVTDASDFAIGCVLEQEHSDGRHPVEYSSQKLNTGQKNYPVHAKELFAIVHGITKWRHYLQGLPLITVETDHNPLKYIKSQPKLSVVQLRWLDTISEYNLDIVYKPGKDNTLADALSRREDLELNAVTLTTSDSVDIDLIKEGYLQDSYFTPVLNALMKPDEPVDKQLIVKSKRFSLADDGLLYYVHGENQRLCVPKFKDIRDKILNDFHDCRISGHLGYDIVYDKLHKIFFWPRMDKSIKYYISTCDKCQKTKPRSHLQNGLLYPHDVPPYPFHTVSMDLIVELPRTKSRFNAIVVFVCKLSKYTYLVPTSTNATAKDIAHAYFENIFRHHGLPSTIVSDRDSRFTSSFWQELQKMCGTKINLTTAFHPQTDGETERKNRTVEQILRAFVSYRQNDWDEYLTSAEFALNSSVQSATGNSPMFLVSGHEPIVPAMFLNPNSSSRLQSVGQFLLKRANAIQIARDNLVQAQDYMASYANRSRRELEFKIGDKVMINSSNLRNDFDKERPSAKLADVWYGPYLVTKVISSVAYKLNLPTSLKNVHNVFHVSKLKKYANRDENVRIVINDYTNRDLNEDDIEAVIDNRVIKRGNNEIRQFLVQLKGQTVQNAKWMNESLLKNCQTLLPDELDLNSLTARDVSKANYELI